MVEMATMAAQGLALSMPTQRVAERSAPIQASKVSLVLHPCSFNGRSIESMETCSDQCFFTLCQCFSSLICPFSFHVLAAARFQRLGRRGYMPISRFLSQCHFPRAVFSCRSRCRFDFNASITRLPIENDKNKALFLQSDFLFYEILMILSEGSWHCWVADTKSQRGLFVAAT